MKTIKLILAGMLFAVTGLAVAAPNFKAGDWGMEYKMQITGAPFPMPTITFRKSMCLDKKNYVPNASQDKQDCKHSDVKVKGNTVSWKLVCSSDRNQLAGHGQMTYKGDTSSGTMVMTSTDGQGNAMQYKYTIKGQRFGACDKQ